MHEVVELVKAIAWPLVALYVLISYRNELRDTLYEMPNLVRRMRSAHGLGIEVQLDKLENELPKAQAEAQTLVLNAPDPPALNLMSSSPTLKQLTGPEEK